MPSHTKRTHHAVVAALTPLLAALAYTPAEIALIADYISRQGN